MVEEISKTDTIIKEFRKEIEKGRVRASGRESQTDRPKQKRELLVHATIDEKNEISFEQGKIGGSK